MLFQVPVLLTSYTTWAKTTVPAAPVSVRSLKCPLNVTVLPVRYASIWSTVGGTKSRARRIGDPAADLRPEPLGPRASVGGREELPGRQVQPLLKTVWVVERDERRHLGRPRLVGELRLGLVRGEVDGRPHVVRVEPRVVVAGKGVDHDAVRGAGRCARRQRHVWLERPVVRRLDLTCVRVVAAVLAVDRAGEGRGDGEAGGLHRRFLRRARAGPWTGSSSSQCRSPDRAAAPAPEPVPPAGQAAHLRRTSAGRRARLPRASSRHRS